MNPKALVESGIPVSNVLLLSHSTGTATDPKVQDQSSPDTTTSSTANESEKKKPEPVGEISAADSFIVYYKRLADDGTTSANAFVFSLLPAIESGFSKSMNIPEIKPGIMRATAVDLKRFTIPGGSPAIQSLGVKQTILQIVGIFVGNEKLTSSGKVASINQFDIYNRFVSLHAYANATVFDREIVQAGRPVNVEIISAVKRSPESHRGLMQKGSPTTISHKVYIQNFRYFAARSDLVYYAFDAILLDYGSSAGVIRSARSSSTTGSGTTGSGTTGSGTTRSGTTGSGTTGSGTTGSGTTGSGTTGSSGSSSNTGSGDPPEVGDNPGGSPPPEVGDNPGGSPPPEVGDNPGGSPPPEVDDNPGGGEPPVVGGDLRSVDPSITYSNPGGEEFRRSREQFKRLIVAVEDALPNGGGGHPNIFTEESFRGTIRSEWERALYIHVPELGRYIRVFTYTYRGSGEGGGRIRVPLSKQVEMILREVGRLDESELLTGYVSVKDVLKLSPQSDILRRSQLVSLPPAKTQEYVFFRRELTYVRVYSVTFDKNSNRYIRVPLPGLEHLFKKRTSPPLPLGSIGSEIP